MLSAVAARPGPGWVWLVLPALPLLLLADAALGTGPAGWRDVLQSLWHDDTIGQAIAWDSRLPRALAALLVGGALGMAGCLMQSLTRNALASPDILAVTQGAHLALVAATLALPWLPPVLATVLGGVVAGALSLRIAGGASAPPARLALCGLAVGLACAAAAQAVVVLADDRAAGLVLWSAGALDQAGWARIGGQLPLGLVAVAAVAAAARGLDVLALGHDQARGLGVGAWVPALAAGSAVLLAAGAVMLAGPIGFVGLAAPNLVRLAAVRRHRLSVPLSAAWGAGLLLAADMLAQALAMQGATVPVGVVVAGLGAPALMIAARTAGDTRAAAALPGLRRRPNAIAVWTVVAGLAALAALAGIAAGEAGTPWALALDLRLPRVLAAGLAGAALALAGLLLQSALGNPLAGPETLGLMQAAALASVLAVLGGLAPGGAGFAAATLAGAALGLLVLRAVAGATSAARLTLVGLGLAAGLTAMGVLVIIGARLQATQALTWLAGTTHGRDLPALAPLALTLLAAAPLLIALSRRMDVLLLGPDAASALGTPVGLARTGLLAVAGVLTAGAVSAVGAVGFVGLLAPHAARLLGGPLHRRALPLGAALGAILTILADVLGRSVLAPREVPLGLVTALLGAPLFLLMLRRP